MLRIVFSLSCLRIYLLFIPPTGRSPNTKRLNLEAVGVELDQAGAVKVVTNFLLFQML